MAGIKLRMPGSDAWQFLGKALGANPTPMAYSEVYTGLQTGAIDGQDNPLPNDYNMKFYEVTSQIVLTSHLIGFDLFVVSKKTWDKLSAEQRAKLEGEVKKAIAWSTQKHLDEEGKLAQFFADKGLKVYKPDVDAFLDYAQKMYLSSDFAKTWPKGQGDLVKRREETDGTVFVVLEIFDSAGWRGGDGFQNGEDEAGEREDVGRRVVIAVGVAVLAKEDVLVSVHDLDAPMVAIGLQNGLWRGARGRQAGDQIDGFLRLLPLSVFLDLPRPPEAADLSDRRPLIRNAGGFCGQDIDDAPLDAPMRFLDPAITTAEGEKPAH